MPKTSQGKWSIGLIVAFFLLLELHFFLLKSGQRGGETFFSNLTLAINLIISGLSGISSFFTGAYAILKMKERSLLVFISTAIGAFVLIFWLGEILSPH